MRIKITKRIERSSWTGRYQEEEGEQGTVSEDEPKIVERTEERGCLESRREGGRERVDGLDMQSG
jgi:hypothetical protein